MKILFIAPRFPYPADTGAKIRTLNILKQIARYTRVDFVTFSFEPGDHDHVSALEELGVRVHLVEANEPALLTKIRHVLSHPRPFSVVKYDSLRMRALLQQLSADEQYDAVHIDHIHMAVYMNIFQDSPVFIDEHNVEYKILERCANLGRKGWKKSLFLNQAAKMKSYERSAIRGAQGCFAVSLDDQTLLENLVESATPVYVVPNGVDTRFFDTEPIPDQPESVPEDSLVFTGSMDWLPNSDAVAYFVREILPKIWLKNKNVKFYVVGKAPSKKLLSLARHDKRIVVTGRVEDVRDYVRRARAFVVPIRVGGGTRLKILEAMSMRKAVVSTAIGAEGIEYSDNGNIMIADDPGKFADIVVQLMNDQEKVIDLGNAGRELVCHKYDWDIVGKKLLQIYQG